ncbi:4Fe-4S binding protein [Neptuniibacter sp. QD34_54]|uniref:4Fe-4S binding protein n=1 Tax=Neptuniibacter sp. QD34_54 TaxID=3398208 RepID=UPI0039F62F71
MTTEQSVNAKARNLAIKQVSFPQNLAPATVTYSTYGHLLITGAEDTIRLAAAQLSGMASITLLATDPISNTDTDHLQRAIDASPELKVHTAKLSQIKGFLGQFQVTIDHQGNNENFAKIAQNKNCFDLILNLGQESLFTTDLTPAGYFHVSPESSTFSEVIEELPNYIGEFEKPRYFQINNDICAHSNRGQTGCTRCLDVCPADAITSFKDLIEINPHMCHGAGGCATACPTGAISYALPQPVMLHNYLHRLISTYQNNGGTAPTILIHDHEVGAEIIANQPELLSDNVLPVSLEEVAAAGQESWLVSLASGAQQVLLLDTPNVPDMVRDLLKRELKTTHAMLEGLGYPTEQIKLITQDDLPNAQSASSYRNIPTIAVVAETNKREALFVALEHLTEHGETANQDYIALPAGAPFGQVNVNSSSCTLCLSCVAVCPTQSLTDGGEMPALNFREQSCVQCGMCESACPENAIELVTQLNLKAERAIPVQIHTDEAFECISCGKPFAPKRTVDKMIEKLSSHRFFQGDAIQRLKMCEDCRVNDIYTDLTANPEKQLEL